MVWKWSSRLKSHREGDIKENPYRRAGDYGWDSKEEQPTWQKGKATAFVGDKQAKRSIGHLSA